MIEFWGFGELACVRGVGFLVLIGFFFNLCLSFFFGLLEMGGEFCEYFCEDGRLDSWK